MTQQCPSSLLGGKLKAYIGRGLHNPVTGLHNPMLLDDAVSYAYDMFSYPILFCHLWEEKDRWVAFIKRSGVRWTVISLASLTHVHYTGVIHGYVFKVYSARSMCPIKMQYPKHVQAYNFVSISHVVVVTQLCALWASGICHKHSLVGALQRFTEFLLP